MRNFTKIILEKKFVKHRKTSLAEKLVLKTERNQNDDIHFAKKPSFMPVHKKPIKAYEAVTVKTFDIIQTEFCIVNSL